MKNADSETKNFRKKKKQERDPNAAGRNTH